MQLRTSQTALKSNKVIIAQLFLDDTGMFILIETHVDLNPEDPQVVYTQATPVGTDEEKADKILEHDMKVEFER